MAKTSNKSSAALQKSSLLLNDQLCFAVYSTGLAMTKLYRKLLKELGLTYPQYLVMLVLWEKDKITVSEVGAPLQLDSATLTPLLKRLESFGLITRTRSTGDDRQVITALTQKGRDLRKLAVEIPGTVDIATGCTSPELSSLKKQLQGLRDRLISACKANGSAGASPSVNPECESQPRQGGQANRPGPGRPDMHRPVTVPLVHSHQT
jgi:MarR family transcriptional regulator, organic hydroperoxide resistance regulator